MSTEERRLTRSSPRWVAGVCAGLAEYFGWSRGAVRMGWVLLTILSAGFPGFLAYMVLAVVMPPPSSRGRGFRLEDYRAQ